MKVRRNISMDEEINDNLSYLADSSNRSVSQWITDRVLEHLNKNKNKRNNK